MFGFGKTKEEMMREQQKNEHRIMNDYAKQGMAELFGTSDPKMINQQMRKYMPELMNTIKVTKETTDNIGKHVFQQGQNQLAIAKDLLAGIEELKRQNEEKDRKYQELQEKYNALVERMAAYIERDGRGR